MAILENATKTDDGITLNGVLMQPIIEQCEGCERIRDFEEQHFCSTYANPERKWVGGRCNFSTHVKTKAAKAAKVNPLKASKRAAKGR